VLDKISREHNSWFNAAANGTTALLDGLALGIPPMIRRVVGNSGVIGENSGVYKGVYWTTSAATVVAPVGMVATTGRAAMGALRATEIAEAGEAVAGTADRLVSEGAFGGWCFVAGTQVAEADGLHNIEDIQPGDHVRARNEATGVVELRTVLDTYITQDAEIVEVTIADDHGVTEAIRSTPTHPYWVEGRDWVRAGDLRAGDVLWATAVGQWHVQSERHVAEHATVYNLNVDSFHSYFVGHTGVWVHNTCAAAEGVGLAARFGATAERSAVLERALTSEGGLNASATVAKQLAGGRAFIPTQSIAETIANGVRAADPQGVAGQFMYTAEAAYNGSRGALEVLVHEATGQIRHVLFRSVP
jgi:hypothetical protein